MDEEVLLCERQASGHTNLAEVFVNSANLLFASFAEKASHAEERTNFGIDLTRFIFDRNYIITSMIVIA